MLRPLACIVDDDASVRSSMTTLLTTRNFDVETFESGTQFLSGSSSARIPDCILLDMQMPGASGLDVLRDLCARRGQPPVIVVTAHADIGSAIAAMKLGAADYLEKPFRPEDLIDAMNSAIAGNEGGTAADDQAADAARRIAALSARQREILEQMLTGRQNKMIAYLLGLSIRTIEAYRAQMLLNLGVRSSSEAIALARTAGL